VILDEGDEGAERNPSRVSFSMRPGTTVEYRDYKFSQKRVTQIKGVVIRVTKERVSAFGDGRVTSLKKTEVTPSHRAHEEILEDLSIAQESLSRVEGGTDHAWLIPHLRAAIQALHVEMGAR